jgi:energy-coupling factor transporter ATP-binding protein EcfA2
MKSSAQTGFLFGRRPELARVVAAIRDRQSLLIFGPPESGKSALVEHALASLPSEIARQCVRVVVEGSFQRLLQQHVVQLAAAEDPAVQAAYGKQGAGCRSAETWARKQTSGRLRSLLFQAFDRSFHWLFWDNVRQLGLAHYHFLREVIWMRKTPVCLLARGLAYEHLGQTGRLFWSDEQRLELGPLTQEDAGALLEAAIAREGLASLDLSEFREQVLEVSRNLPGIIVKMVAMAGKPRYQHGDRVKTKLIYTDYLVQLASRVQI